MLAQSSGGKTVGSCQGVWGHRSIDMASIRYGVSMVQKCKAVVWHRWLYQNCNLPVRFALITAIINEPSRYTRFNCHSVFGSNELHNLNGAAHASTKTAKCTGNNCGSGLRSIQFSRELKVMRYRHLVMARKKAQRLYLDKSNPHYILYAPSGFCFVFF